MKPLRKLVTSLIGFDRRERRGTYVLSILLIVFLLIRMIAFRPGKIPGELPPLSVQGEGGDTGTPFGKDEKDSSRLFIFDPNTASQEELLALGLSERQSRTLVNYRSSGARFRKPEDLARVYGIDPAIVARLIPYIHIGEEYAASGTGGTGGTGGSANAGPAGTVRGSADGNAVRKPKPGAGTENSGYGYRSADASATAAEGIAGGGERSAAPAAIDLNLCTAEDLVGLPGIGPVLSVRIIRYRSLLGGFVDAGQMEEVYGLDSSVVRLVAGRVTLTFDSVRPLELATATFGDLARHPYLGYEAARQITRYRSVATQPLTLGEMVVRGVITKQQAERIAPYVRPAGEVSGSDYEFILSKVLK